jgi:PAS domain S-box-containing protein
LSSELDRAERAARLRVRLYVAFLAATMAAILGLTLVDGTRLLRDPSWVWLSLVFAFSEYAMLLFHHQRGRQGLSAAEAVLLPMLIALPFPEAVWGVTVATILVNVARRVTPVKAIFNVAEYGCAAAAAAGIWALYHDGSVAFSPANALLAVFAVLVFAFLTHALVSVAISLAEGRTLAELSREIAPAIGLNLAGNVTLGVLFAASYQSAEWTVALFPFAIGALYLGYRAVVKQTLERERVSHLHAASRALAVSPDMGRALIEFLHAVAETTSASEARVVVSVQKQRRWSGVRGEEVLADLEPVQDGPLEDLLHQVELTAEPIVAGLGDDRASEALLRRMGAQSMVVAPLLEGRDVVGCLVSLDRVGAGAFGRSDAQILEALASELALSLDSYRLFGEVIEERSRFRRIFHGSKEGICLLDDQGIVRAWNPALQTITGYDAEEMVGHPWWDKLVVRDRQQRRLVDKDLIAAEAGEELEVLTRSGPARWVSVVADEVASTDETGWVVLLRDVTAQHLAEEAKSDFVSTISHELRTPLTTIKGSLQVLERGASKLSPEAIDQMVDVLGRGADRLERLVMNLLFVSQLESDRVTIVPDQVDLNVVAGRRVRRFADDRIRMEPNPSELVVRADKEKLRQTIDHLLDNALKYGGSAPVVVKTALVNGYGRIIVSDQGPGIAHADQERIFERFVRLGDPLTREAQGAGVGLFIAKRSVEAMEGRIWVESAEGRGATFVVDLPLARPMAVPNEASA